jgi:hypothetical protein
MPNNDSLFGDLDEFTLWKKEWQGMPEFVQDDASPYHSIRVNFEIKEDMDEFSQVIGQRINPETMSVWFPKKDRDYVLNKVYIDEPNKD